MNARRAQDAEASTDVEVVLIEITHPELTAPIRLSTDNTERLGVDPLMYGTRSTWRGANPVSDPYLFIIADALLPDEAQDAPAEAQISLVALDAQYTSLLRSFQDPATLNMAVVLSSTPDVIEGEFLDLQLTTSEWGDGEVKLTFSNEDIELERFPPGRMTRSKFPGLHS